MFLVSKCPYCQTEKIPFDIEGIYYQSITQDNNSYIIYFSIFSICRECRAPTIFSIYKDIIGDVTAYNFDGSAYIDQDKVNKIVNETFSIVRNNPDQNLLNHFQLKKIIRPPTYTSYQCPEYVPDTIKNIFEEAAQCYAHDLLRASLSMLRTCLDLATKGLLTEDKDKTLFKRIEILCKQGLIRPRLEKMASEIRIDGNIAAHDGYVNQESLKSIFHFTIFLLRELFTDPTEMETNEERRAQLKQGKVK